MFDLGQSVDLVPLGMLPTSGMNATYRIRAAATARAIARDLLAAYDLADRVAFGLPEVDDRYHIWRVPVLTARSSARAGEIVIDARTGAIDRRRSTRRDLLLARLVGAASLDTPHNGNAPLSGDGSAPEVPKRKRNSHRTDRTSAPVGNTIIGGDARLALDQLPPESVHLIFTSPPYFNARPGYTEYATYDDYLATLRGILEQCHRVLADGRFLVINVAPVLIRRASRQEASRRLAVPFDVHALAIAAGFDFIDDIIWEKPEGAGWATGRGRRFAADRQPLQYKPVPVTEYILVYRRRTDRLIDWHLRNHPDPRAVAASRINGEYDRTNIWRIKPATSRLHPAVFPVELAERVIRYYSFQGDVVLDPFAGIGTTGEAAVRLGRRFVLIEREEEYLAEMRRRAAAWQSLEAGPVTFRLAKPLPKGARAAAENGE